MKKTWPFFLAGFIALFYWTKAKAIEKLQYYVDGVSGGIVSGYPVITLNLAVNNPTNQQFTIKSLIGTLTANGQPIGRVESHSEVVILPAGQSHYPISVQVVLAGVALTVYNLISQGIGNTQTLGFNGAVNASGIVAPLDITLTVG